MELLSWSHDAETDMLVALCRQYPHEVTLAALSAEAAWDVVQLTDLFSRLADCGLVQLRVSPQDGHGGRARLTECGMAVAVGLAKVDGGPRQVIDKLEAATVYQLKQQMSRRRQLLPVDSALDQQLARRRR